MLVQTDLYSFAYLQGMLVPFCKKCSAENSVRDGYNVKGHQVHKCKVCNFRFVWTSDLPGRTVFSNIITFALELYTTTGISLRELANKLKKFFKVKITHEGIRQWVITCKKPQYKPLVHKATRWHVDETYIKIKGKSYWLWIVYCRDTKQVLSWHISKTRTIKDAKKLLCTALRVTKVRPKSIMTDGLKQYIKAIKKVMGWHWRTYKEKHRVESGVGPNAIIERVNREVKRRLHWFDSFQSIQGARAFFTLYFHHYNQSDH